MTSLDALKQAAAHGDRLEFLFFWGHHQSGRRATIGPECFSQWYPAPITLQGLTFPTAEHLMMFRKARLFDDDESATRVLAAPGTQRGQRNREDGERLRRQQMGRAPVTPTGT